MILLFFYCILLYLVPDFSKGLLLNMNRTSTGPNINGSSTMPNINGTSTMPNINGTSTMPNINGTSTMPNLNGTSTMPNINGTSTMPNINGTLPSINETLPNINGTLPNINGILSNIIGPLLNINGTLPNINGILSNINGIVSNINGILSNINGISSNINGILSTINVTLPNINGILSNIIGPLLNINGTLPNINGSSAGLAEDPDVHMNVTQLITSKGYPCEEYDVHTQDGYILGIQRITAGKGQSAQAGNSTAKPVVFLQHPLLSCASCWVENLANNSLGFMLADAGFDVWLGNNRGNMYSKRHERLSPDQKEFWNWSFDEMAKYDLPAMVDKALSISGAQQVFYVGHSQGGGLGIAQLSEDPVFASKIKMYVGLAPGVYMDNVKSPISLLMPFMEDIEHLETLLGGHGEFLPESDALKWLANDVCAAGDIPLFLCENILFIICGYDYDQLNASRIPVYVNQHPAGTSFKNMLQFAQLAKSKEFQMFDYGAVENMKKYNQTTPPIYYPGNITVPVALYSGGNDWLVTPTEMQRLVPQIQHLVKNVVIDHWEHLDFIWALDAPKQCYNDIIKTFKALP